MSSQSCRDTAEAKIQLQQHFMCMYVMKSFAGRRIFILRAPAVLRSDFQAKLIFSRTGNSMLPQSSFYEVVDEIEMKLSKSC